MARLSLTGKRWIFSSSVNHPLERTPARKRSEEIRDLLAEARGVGGDVPLDLLETVSQLFPQLECALERTRRAVRDGELIGIFGDYDCDGITAVTQLAQCLRRLGAAPILRLPHRTREGYGLREEYIEEFALKGVRLLLTADTGIGCAKEVATARTRGMDVIILDHHHAPPLLPEAAAILHPCLKERATDPWPAAAGIAWMFAEALERERDHAGEERDADTSLALACIGTIADLVELKGWNRALVRAGLHSLHRLRDGPLAALKEQTGITSFPTSRDVGFRIAPRINAAGRMADPAIALRGLLGDSASLLMLHELNRERQAQVSQILAGVLEDLGADSSPFLCIGSGDFPPGIIGLIASKLTDVFGRPSIVGSLRGESCTASLRSIPGYHVTEALARHREVLKSFGGHAQAAGCSVAVSSWPVLCELLKRDAQLRTRAEERIPSLTVDLPLHNADVTLDLCRALSTLEPFGQGNPEPRFLLENQTLERARTVGSDSSHLQASLGATKVIGFGLGHFLQHARSPLDLVCRLGVDAWNGREHPQLFLEDMAPAVFRGTSRDTVGVSKNIGIEQLRAM